MAETLEIKNDFRTNAITVVVTVFVIAGLWLAAMSARESMLFSNITTQVLGIVSGTRFLDSSGALRGVQNENILALLRKRQMLPSVVEESSLAYIINPWEQRIVANASLFKTLSVETTIPTYVCRRMVDFFVKDASGLGLVKVEAKDYGASVWRQVFNAGNDAQPRSVPQTAIEVGCGNSPYAVISLVFAVK